MESLQHHFLIATPALDDSFFERSLIYICEHDNKGAMGLVLTQPVGIDINELLAQMELADEPISIPEKTDAVLSGGPIDQERGFVLHTNQGNWTHSDAITDDIVLTSSRDILSALGTAKAPQNYIILLGYAGWKRHQLEHEIAENSWLTVPANTDILFHTHYEDRWEKATDLLGFDIWQLSNQIGHA